ncbi:MAG: UDP-N-acetylmuramate dehydrogenase [Deltaproteobacteria bacterium]|nr:UDP-N-acetylmuramate dehydrogenase [Deltaproteobacteria bacterium]
MDHARKKALQDLFGDRIRFDHSLAAYTTLRVGGRAEAFFEAHTAGDLARLIGFLSSSGIPYFVLGAGSNLVVPDEGVRGVVILLRGLLAGVEKGPGEPPSILVGAGFPLPDLLTFCRREGLGGLEFLAGIPGTMGGAAIMNAGAFGKETGSAVVEMEVMDRRGQVFRRRREELRFRYRGLDLPTGWVVLRVRMVCEASDPATVGGRIAVYLKRRKLSQPLEHPSGGSVFKNPPGRHAGRLLEEAGLKGKRVGGAMISTKHANWIVNTGNATARDILELMRLARRTVEEKTGVLLEPEIRILGQ